MLYLASENMQGEKQLHPIQRRISLNALRETEIKRKIGIKNKIFGSEYLNQWLLKTFPDLDVITTAVAAVKFEILL